MKKKIRRLTYQEAIDNFGYDPKTGNLWRKHKGPSKPILRLNSQGYITSTIIIDGQKISYKAHQVVWLLVHGYNPVSFEIDHINGVKHDNRACNLRIVSHGCNIRNSIVKKNNKTGVKGVYIDSTTKKFGVKIEMHKRAYFLGRFKVLADAIYARAYAETLMNATICDKRSSAIAYCEEHNILRRPKIEAKIRQRLIDRQWFQS